LVLKDNDGKEHTYTVGRDATLICDGKKVEAATFKTDLKEGTKIRVWPEKDDPKAAMKIEALNKNTDFEK
jgi:hypothetical protein